VGGTQKPRSGSAAGSGDEAIVDGALHKQARPGDAGLPRTGEDRLLRTLHGGGEIGIGEDDIRGFAAEFEHAGNGARGAGGGHGGPRSGAAHEDHFRDFRRGEQRRAGPLPRPADDLHEARRQPRLHAQAPERKRGERRELGGFEHHRIAGGKRREDVPPRREERRVPGCDGKHDAIGLAPDDHGMARGHGHRPALDLVAPAGPVFGHLGHARGLGPRITQGLAGLRRLDPCQRLRLPPHKCAHGPEPASALGGRERHPCALRPRRACAGQGDALRIGGLVVDQHLARGRVDQFEAGPTPGDDLPVDQAARPPAEQAAQACEQHLSRGEGGHGAALPIKKPA
jgi:hypothetical protein